MRTLYKQLQARLDESEARAAIDAAHSSASMSEQDVLRQELRELRASYADAREELAHVQARCNELENQLVAERRRAQDSLHEAERGRERSEHELSRARSELAAARQALAVATANVEDLKNAHDELLTRIAAYEDTSVNL